MDYTLCWPLGHQVGNLLSTLSFCCTFLTEPDAYLRLDLQFAPVFEASTTKTLMGLHASQFNTNLKFANRITNHILFNAVSIIFLCTQKVLVEFVDCALNEFGLQIFKRSIHPNVIVSQPYFAQPLKINRLQLNTFWYKRWISKKKIKSNLL